MYLFSLLHGRLTRFPKYKVLYKMQTFAHKLESESFKQMGSVSPLHKRKGHTKIPFKRQTVAYVQWDLGEPVREVPTPCDSPSAVYSGPEETINVNDIIEHHDGIFQPFGEADEIKLKFSLEDSKTGEETRVANTQHDLRVQVIDGVCFLSVSEDAKPEKFSGKAKRTLHPGAILAFCHHSRERKLELYRNSVAHA